MKATAHLTVPLRHSEQVRFFVLLLAVLSLADCARAAVVEGVVLDEETGFPLARAQVSLIPLPGTKASSTGVSTGPRGSFVILSVLPGWYTIRATRRGYAQGESGQLRPGRPGHAFEVADDHAAGFLEIKLSHLPAITGAVLDENGIGIPKWPVHVYSSGKPVRHVAQTVTDERGNYRVGELIPGTYLVRSGPGPLEDRTPLLATYSKAAIELADATAVSVHVGETRRDVVLKPVKGRFFTLAGNLIPFPKASATLTLITDTGRRVVASAYDVPMPFSAGDVQPGTVELIVTGFDPLGNQCGSYSRVVVDKDVSGLRLVCSSIGPATISIGGATLKAPAMIRRVDLDGAAEARQVAKDEFLLPGHWEISIPPGDYYVTSVRNSGTAATHSGEWWGFDSGSYTRLAVTLSSNTASIGGVVSTSGNPVTGAPVFLRNIGTGQTWNGRSDPQGHYSMGGLAPGNYAIVSGFDLDFSDASTSEKMVAVYVSEGNAAVQALELVRP